MHLAAQLAQMAGLPPAQGCLRGLDGRRKADASVPLLGRFPRAAGLIALADILRIEPGSGLQSRFVLPNLVVPLSSVRFLGRREFGQPPGLVPQPASGNQ